MLSHVIEDLAEAAGSDATLVTMFQRGMHFQPMIERYERLARTGATVVVGYAGTGPRSTPLGPTVLELDESHPLRDEWSIMLITSNLAAHISVNDLHDLDSTEPDPGHGRRFSGRWGFDRRDAGTHLERLLLELDGEVEPRLRIELTETARRAEGPPLTRVEHGLGAAARKLVECIEEDQRVLSVLRGSLVAQHERAH